MVMSDIAMRLRNVTPFNVNGENKSGIGGSSLIFETSHYGMPSMLTFS